MLINFTKLNVVKCQPQLYDCCYCNIYNNIINFINSIMFIIIIIIINIIRIPQYFRLSIRPRYSNSRM